MTHHFLVGTVDPRTVKYDHDHYQREYRPKYNRRVYFDPDTVLNVLPVTISRRKDGSLYCIDGQHRLMEAVARGIDSVHAVIIEGFSIEDEALLFADINEGSRKMTATELWKAKRTGKDPEAVNLQVMLDEEGIILKPGRLLVADGDHTVSSIGDMQWVVDRYSLEHLRRSLRFLVDAWPGTGQLLAGANIKAAAGFLNLMDKRPVRVSDEEAAKVMSAVDYSELVEVRRVTWRGPTSGHPAHKVAKSMVVWYDQLTSAPTPTPVVAAVAA